MSKTITALLLAALLTLAGQETEGRTVANYVAVPATAVAMTRGA